MYRYICSLLCVCFISGCSHVQTSLPEPDTSVKLTRLLVALDSHIPYTEAEQLSRDVLHYSQRLEQTFDRTTVPWVHNFMVNTGLKKKGLCYHFSDALYRHLKQKHYPHFSFHLAGAHIGEYWREHNTLVITAKRGKIQNGIIVDPWREQGKVFVSKLNEDKAYKWVHRPERGCR